MIRYSILYLAFWGITFDSDLIVIVTFLFKNYLNGNRQCQMSFK